MDKLVKTIYIMCIDKGNWNRGRTCICDAMPGLPLKKESNLVYRQTDWHTSEQTQKKHVHEASTTTILFSYCYEIQLKSFKNTPTNGKNHTRFKKLAAISFKE